MDSRERQYRTYINCMASIVQLSPTADYYDRINSEMHPLMSDKEFEEHLKDLEIRERTGTPYRNKKD